jgi:hypothetical protein
MASHATKKPSDAAVVEPPTIFVAIGDNCVAAAPIPRAPARNVIAAPDNLNKFSVEVSQIDKIGVKQENDTLCWAACTQTLLRQRNINVRQTDLAKEFVADDPDGDDEEGQAAGLGVMIRALNPDLERELDERGAVPIDLYATTSDQMLTELMSGRLCIVGLVEKKGDGMGHACVVCGATFAKLSPNFLNAINLTVTVNNSSTSADSKAARSGLMPTYGLYQVDLFDPFTARHRTMSGEEFHDQAAFLTSQELSREMLVDALKKPPNTQASPGQVVVKAKPKQTKQTQLAAARLTPNQNKPTSRPAPPRQQRPAPPPPPPPANNAGGKKKA